MCRALRLVANRLVAAQAGLLMAASACGSVCVWRDYTFRNTQRLATAWPVRARLDLPRMHGLGLGLPPMGAPGLTLSAAQLQR